MKMASWNDLGEMSLQFTNLDLFDSLRSTGSIPTDIDYQKKIFEWIKWNVLQKTDLNCREEEWLISHTYHLYCCITKMLLNCSFLSPIDQGSARKSIF